MVIGTALGFSQWGTVALAIALAFVFGYALTSVPLLRAGLAVSAVVSIALASNTLSIATMELVDNALVVAIPGAMNAGVGSHVAHRAQKLVAAEADDQIVGAQMLNDAGDDACEQLVAGEVPVAVVGGL